MCPSCCLSGKTISEIIAMPFKQHCGCWRSSPGPDHSLVTDARKALGDPDRAPDFGSQRDLSPHLGFSQDRHPRRAHCPSLSLGPAMNSLRAPGASVAGCLGKRGTETQIQESPGRRLLHALGTPTTPSGAAARPTLATWRVWPTFRGLCPAQQPEPHPPSLLSTRQCALWLSLSASGIPTRAWGCTQVSVNLGRKLCALVALRPRARASQSGWSVRATLAVAPEPAGENGTAGRRHRWGLARS